MHIQCFTRSSSTLWAGEHVPVGGVGIPSGEVTVLGPGYPERPSNTNRYGQPEVGACALVLLEASQRCGECDNCRSPVGGEAGWNRENDELPAGFRPCQQPKYQPCVPRRLPDSIARTAGTCICVSCQPDDAADCAWKQRLEDNNGPSYTRRQVVIPWGYTLNKSFHDVFLRAFVGDIFGEYSYGTIQVPAPEDLKATVLRQLRTWRGVTANRLVQNLMLPGVEAAQTGKCTVERAAMMQRPAQTILT